MNEEFLRDPITGELPRRRHPPWFWIALGSLVVAILLGIAARMRPVLVRWADPPPTAGECGLHHGHDSTLMPLEGDRAALTTPADLPLGARRALDPGRETLDRIHHGDCSFGIAYAYQDPAFEVQSSIAWKTTLADARKTYAAELAPRAKATPGDELVRWGDESALWFETRDGAPVGCTFVARRGNDVFRVRWSGAAFEPLAAEELRALIEPLLERMAAYAG